MVLSTQYPVCRKNHTIASPTSIALRIRANGKEYRLKYGQGWQGLKTLPHKYTFH